MTCACGCSCPSAEWPRCSDTSAIIPCDTKCSRTYPSTSARRSSAPNSRGREISTRSEEHTSELQSLMRISYAVFCLKKKKTQNHDPNTQIEANKQTTEEPTTHHEEIK